MADHDHTTTERHSELNRRFLLAWFGGTAAGSTGNVATGLTLPSAVTLEET